MKHIRIYLLFSFSSTWLMWVIINNFEFQDYMSSILMIVSVYMPAITVWVMKIFTKEDDITIVSLEPHVKKNTRWYLIAWILPIVFTFLSALLYYSIFSNDFDLTDNLLRTDGIKILTAILIHPFINTFLCLGEEMGWRGFLFPELIKHVSRNKTHILVGVIWGLWHIPLTIVGHNYGLEYFGYPWSGVLTLCIFTFASGVFLSWLTENSSSIWPAALGHSTINSMGKIPYLFLSTENPSNRLFGPAITGLISALPMIILAIILIIKERHRAIK